MSDAYSSEYHDQVAAAYQRGGHEEMAERVLAARQHRRYAAAGRTTRIWGVLQRFTVGYGYRPSPAVCWLIGPWMLGSAWFPFHQPVPVDAGQNPPGTPGCSPPTRCSRS